MTTEDPRELPVHDLAIILSKSGSLVVHSNVHR
jgi:hypothetical protein